MDVYSKNKRSAIMRAVKSADTNPELAVMSQLLISGVSFTRHVKSLPGTPDIVLEKSKVAIQIRGCFWHGHSCRNGRAPKSRKAYWDNKLLNNIRRDRRCDRLLRQMGWRVMVVWECRIRSKKGLDRQVARIRSFVNKKK